MVFFNQKGVIFSASKQSCMGMPVKQHSLTRLKKQKHSLAPSITPTWLYVGPKQSVYH